MTVAALALPDFADLALTVEQAESYARGARADSTRRCYAEDLRDFQRFCRSVGLEALPATPQTITVYVTSLAQRGQKIATIRRRLVGISIAHKDRNLQSPTSDPMVHRVMKGIANAIGSSPRRKAAITNDMLPATLLAAGETLKGIRDRAILLLGFSAALRRSEIAALEVRDLRFDRQGLVVTLRRSKTDQAGEGRDIGLPFVELEQLCAVRAVRRWLEAASIREGHVFRPFGPSGVREGQMRGADIARLMQLVTKRAGLAGDFGGHSLRAGFVTSCAAKGVPEIRIMETTGHKSVAILRGYVRRATVFEGSPLRSIFAR